MQQKNVNTMFSYLHQQAAISFISQGSGPSYAQSATSGTTLGIALGGVSVFMVVVVAIFMVKRKNRNLPRNPEYDVVCSQLSLF